MGVLSRLSNPLRGVGRVLRVSSGTRLGVFLVLMGCSLGAFSCWVLSMRARAGDYDIVIHGVTIRIPEVPQLPKAWDGDPYRCRATKLRPALREKGLKQVGVTLQTYPQRILSQCLDTVVLVGDLKSRDLNPAGAYWDRTLFLVVGNLVDDKAAADLSQTMHHEISSLLMARFAVLFPTEQWVQSNPPDFQYRLGEIVRPEDNTAVTEKDAADGFACSYGRMDMENDFNTIVENLCVPADGFPGFVRKYSRLRAKAVLAVRFYQEIDAELVTLFDRGILDELGIVDRNGD